MVHKPSRPQVRIQTDMISEIPSSSNSDVKPEEDQPPTERSKERQDDGKVGNGNEKENSASISSSDHTDEKPPTKQKFKLPKSLQWIPANSTWSKWKPVIRSALAAWIAVVIFIIPRTENILGQVCCVVILWFCWLVDHIFEGSFPYHNR